MRLCIVGNGVTRDRAPFDDPDALIWTTASVAQHLPRVDCVFELHDGVYDAEFLNRFGCTVMMKEEDDCIARSERFPIEVLIEKFGQVFNGTMVMILAYAWIMGYDTVELYGIDFSSEDEINRRMMFMYVKGRIEGMGGRVLISPGSYLVDVCPTYQYETPPIDYVNDIGKRASDQINELSSSMSRMAEEVAYRKGILETIATIKRRNLW